MSLAAKILGTKELNTLLKKFPERIQRNVLNATAARGATVIKKHMKKNLKANGAVRSGKLLKAVKSKKKKGVHGIQTIFTDKSAFYSKFVEFGTGARTLKKPMALMIKPGKIVIAEKTGAMPAKPFFRPALDENKTEVLKEMALMAAKRMSKEAVKMSGKYKTFSSSYKKALAK